MTYIKNVTFFYILNTIMKKFMLNLKNHLVLVYNYLDSNYIQKGK